MPDPRTLLTELTKIVKNLTSTDTGQGQGSASSSTAKSSSQTQTNQTQSNEVKNEHTRVER